MFSLMFAQTGFFLVKNREWGGRGMGAGGWGRGNEGKEGSRLTSLSFLIFMNLDLLCYDKISTRLKMLKNVLKRIAEIPVVFYII